MTARSSCLRSRHVVVGALNTARTSAPARAQPGHLLVGQPGRLTGALSGEIGLGLPLRHQRFLHAVSSVRADEPVLGLDSVELAAGALGFEAGPFDGELEDGQSLTVLGLGLPERLGGGGQRRRRQHGEHLVEDPLLEPAPAQALAVPLGP